MTQIIELPKNNRKQKRDLSLERKYVYFFLSKKLEITFSIAFGVCVCDRATKKSLTDSYTTQAGPLHIEYIGNDTFWSLAGSAHLAKEKTD